MSGSGALDTGYQGTIIAACARVPVRWGIPLWHVHPFVTTVIFAVPWDVPLAEVVTGVPVALAELARTTGSVAGLVT